MVKNTQTYTQEGYDKLVDEMFYMKNVKREEAKNALAKARSFGDLSENSEYDEARNEQAKVEARIKELEEMINNAVVINESTIDADVISMGSTVYVTENKKDGSAVKIIYSIVASNEAVPGEQPSGERRISDVSPIGKALIGKKAEESVEVELPNGATRHFLITEVTRAKSNS